MYNCFVNKRNLVIVFVLFFLIIYLVSFLVYGLSPFGIENEKMLLSKNLQKFNFGLIKFNGSSIPLYLLIFLATGYYAGKNEFNQMLAFLIFTASVYFVFSTLVPKIEMYGTLKIENVFNAILISEITIFFSLPKKSSIVKLFSLTIIIYSFYIEALFGHLYVIGIFSSFFVGIISGIVLKKLLNVLL